MIANFVVAGWPVEVFASPVPVARQDGWRHVVAERRLLEIGGEALREHVVMLRRRGFKTEPDFCRSAWSGRGPLRSSVGPGRRNRRRLACCHRVCGSCGIAPVVSSPVTLGAYFLSEPNIACPGTAHEFGSASCDNQILWLAHCRRRPVTVLFGYLPGRGLALEIGFEGGKAVDRCWYHEKILAPIPSMISTG